MISKNQPLAHVDLSGEAGQIDRIVEGYKAYRILQAAVELKLFDWLEKQGSADRDRIAGALKINGMFAKAFLQALVDQGLLINEANQYRNSGIASRLLVSKNECYQGSFIAWPADGTSGWDDLKATITARNPYDSAPESEAILDAMLQRSLRGEVHGFYDAVSSWDGFGKAGRMLDIGSHGLCAITLCQQSPKLKAIVIDHHEYARADRKLFAAAGLKDRIRLEKCHSLPDNPGEKFDLIAVSHVLYWHRDDIPGYLRWLSGNLNPGGLIVSNHWFCSPGCVAPRGLPELEKCIDSHGHPLCHVEQFPEIMEEAGLKFLRSAEMPGPAGPSFLHMAAKEGPKKSSKAKRGKGCGCGCE